MSTAGRLIAEDRRTISYRPVVARALKSANAAILFQQIVYWWYASGERPFFKFKAPCSHRKYVAGDSWTEELALSRHEFDTALSILAAKITQGTNRANHPDTLVYFWTDGSRMTWYELNQPHVDQWLDAIYLTPFSGFSDPKAGIRLLQVKPKSGVSKVKPENDFTLSSEMIPKDDHQSASSDAPAKPNAHGDLLHTWLTASAFKTPPGFKYNGLMNEMKHLLKDGITESMMQDAGVLFGAWWRGNGSPVLPFNVGEAIIYIRTTLQLAERKITASQIERFITERKAEAFWKGRLLPLDRVAKDITADAPIPGVENLKELIPDPERPYLQITRGELQSRQKNGGEA